MRETVLVALDDEAVVAFGGDSRPDPARRSKHVHCSVWGQAHQGVGG